MLRIRKDNLKNGKIFVKCEASWGPGQKASSSQVLRSFSKLDLCSPGNWGPSKYPKILMFV